MKAKFSKLYDKVRFDKRKILIELDHSIADNCHDLQSLRKQNKKIERKYLPKKGTKLSELINLVAEIELMEIKREDAGIALNAHYKVNQ